MCIVAHDNQVSQDFDVCHYSCSRHLLCLFHVSKVSDQRSEPGPGLPQLDEEPCEELGRWSRCQCYRCHLYGAKRYEVPAISVVPEYG